jgi:hypothetical protein
MATETKSYLLRKVPQDVFKLILKEQLKQRLNRGRIVTIEETIIFMLKEWSKCKEFEK